MQSRARRITDDELAAIIDTQIKDAEDFDARECAGIRDKALRYFEAEETLAGDTKIQVGRSRAVSRDMSDTHGWILPSLLRVFLGSDRVVVYEPRRQGKEQEASQATDYINYLFMSECDGYALLYDGIWEALTFGNGIIKHWWDDAPEYRTEEMSGIPEAEYIEVVADPAVEVLEHTERTGEPIDPDEVIQPRQPALPPQPAAPGAPPGTAPGALPSGMMVNGNGAAGPPLMAQPAPPPMVHDLKIKRRVNEGKLRVVAIPQGEFRIDRHAVRIDEDHVRFCAHVTLRTRSALISEGYDREVVDALAQNTSGEIATSDNQARGSWRSGDVAPDTSTELVEIWECYVQLDYDGDGVAEWRRVVAGQGSDKQGLQILANEEWGDGIPFTDLVPDPMPHRWRGGSLYDEIGDLQRIKTVFWRGINDNMYWQNNPQRQYLENAIGTGGLDKLTSPEFGDAIPVRQVGAISELPIPFVADKLMMGLELCDKIREFRTGVSAATMSLDPEALANQTATAVNAAQTASYGKVETYARNIAEYGGLKRLFKCLLRTIVQHQDEPRQIRLRGQWTDMDPRGWDADMDVIINVGLGSGSRDRDLAMLQTVAMKQELIVSSLGPMMAAQLGLGPDVIFETYRKMCEAAGLKSPDSFFPEVTKEQIAAIMQQQGQHPPDPKMMESQAKIQTMQMETQAKLQADQARMAAENQSRQQQAALDWQHRQQQADIDNQHRARELQNRAEAQQQEIVLKHQLAAQQAEREFALRQQEIQANAMLKQRELEIEAALKREQMMMQPNTQANIQQASPS